MIKFAADPHGDTILNTGKSLLTGMLVATLSFSAAPSFAAPDEDEPGAGAMTADLLVGRPFGLVATVLGTSAFVVSLPFSALGGNVEPA